MFSAYVLRNLDSVAATLAEISRSCSQAAWPVSSTSVARGTSSRQPSNRAASAVVVPLAGVLAGAAAEYRYLNRSLDKLPPPEQLFRDSPLRVRELWRMGPLGFVYGAILTKT